MNKASISSLDIGFNLLSLKTREKPYRKHLIKIYLKGETC